MPILMQLPNRALFLTSPGQHNRLPQLTQHTPSWNKTQHHLMRAIRKLITPQNTVLCDYLHPLMYPMEDMDKDPENPIVLNNLPQHASSTQPQQSQHQPNKTNPSIRRRQILTNPTNPISAKQANTLNSDRTNLQHIRFYSTANTTTFSTPKRYIITPKNSRNQLVHFRKGKPTKLTPKPQQFPQGYFLDKNNHKLYLESISQQLGVKNMEDWYQIKRDDVILLSGGRHFLSLYDHSLVRSLLCLYPGTCTNHKEALSLVKLRPHMPLVQMIHGKKSTFLAPNKTLSVCSTMLIRHLIHRLCVAGTQIYLYDPQVLAQFG